LSVTVGTGLRFGEVSALWVGDVDLDHRTIRINKAWKRNGEDDATDTPGWLAKQLKAKHTTRDHHLENPKTPKSRRTITISPAVAKVLRQLVEGKQPDDFVFTSRSGLPLYNGDFYTHVWRKLMKALAAEGIVPFRFHGSPPYPRRLAGRRRGSAAEHPGTTRSRVHHHHDRHLRPPVAGRRRADLRDHRHRSDRRHDPTQGWRVNVLLFRTICNTLGERR
jgi:integrase